MSLLSVRGVSLPLSNNLANDVCAQMFGCSYWPKESVDHVAPVFTDDCSFIYAGALEQGMLSLKPHSDFNFS